MIYTVRRIKIGRSEQLDTLSLECGRLYSLCVVWFWRFVCRQDKWISSAAMMRFLNSNQLHAHTADACVQAFYASLKSWRKRRKTGPNAKPPRRPRKFFRIEYKSSAIRHRDGKLILSNGNNCDPLILNWSWKTPRTVVVRWQGEQYEAIATYAIEQQAEPIGDKVAGIDLGEIHPAVAYDGQSTTIVNGRLLRSKRRYQNKLKAELSRMIAAKKKGSRRWRRLISSKRKHLRKLNNQIKDIEHKQTTRLVSTLHNNGVQTVVIGDVRDIRQDLDYGPKANQKLHQWPHGRVRHMLTYKSERLGMSVKLQNEKYSSQECPACSKRHKPGGRQYVCKCGFRFHRDGVGSFNIRKKYLGLIGIPTSPVVGVMAPPTGLRYSPHSRVARIYKVREAVAL